MPIGGSLARAILMPVVGLQVLHEDGKWYDGQLTEQNQETGKWHILFDDGDKDTYSLPDRCARTRTGASDAPPVPRKLGC